MKLTSRRRAAMARPLAVSLLALPLLTGCFFTLEEEIPQVEHSPGFFSEFDAMIEHSMSCDSVEERTRRLRFGFAEALERGDDPLETVALGSTWSKVETFLKIGLRTADVMAGVEGAAQNREDMYLVAADRVQRSDFPAIEAYNREVAEMGLSDETLQPTGALVRESLDLVLSESEHAVVQRWVESGEWVEGHHERLEGHYEDVWVEGYWETVWQEGTCWEEYVGSDCDVYWVEGGCIDVYVEDGYWESDCDYYDEWGNCLSYTEYWVDLGYWDVVCDAGYYVEDCFDIYETVCEQGDWVDLWIQGFWTQGPWIPGETIWVEGYWRDTSGWQGIVLLQEEAAILSAGIDVILANIAESLDDECSTGLIEAQAAALQADSEVAGELLRDAIMECLAVR